MSRTPPPEGYEPLVSLADKPAIALHQALRRQSLSVWIGVGETRDELTVYVAPLSRAKAAEFLTQFLLTRAKAR